MRTKLLLLLLLSLQVMSLSAKDYSHILKEAELIPIMINGDKGNRINIVILNQWTKNNEDPYNRPELRGEFIKDIEESIIAALTYGHKDAHTAFAHYKEFFNVYGLWWPTVPEWNEGVGHDDVEYIIKELFLPWEDEYTGWATVLIMPNTSNGGGGAGRDLELRKGSALIAGNGIDKMLHEISHTCMSLGDEYTTHQTGTDQVPTYSASIEYRRDEIKWRKWIDEDTPVPTPYTKEYINKIGAFEGNQYHLVDYYRPSAQGCIMGAGVFDNTPLMCATCNQRVVMRVNTLVNIINSSSPANKDITIDGAKSMTFEVDHLKPFPNTQVVRWYLNGKLIEKDKDKISVKFGDLKEYKLVCEITDESDFVRPDPPYGAYPVREVVWNITNSSSKVASESLDVKIEESKGTLSAVVKGGKAPYTYIWADGSSTKTIENAKSGVYNLTVVDGQYKSGDAKYVVYEDCCSAVATSKNGDKLSPTINIFAPQKGKENGRIIISAPEGSEYSYEWGDRKNVYRNQIVYEAEDCKTTLTKDVKEFWVANGFKYINLKGAEGELVWDVEVAKAGVYPIEIVYATLKEIENPEVKVISSTGDSQNVVLPNTRPHYIGWDVKKVYLKLDKGANQITLKSIGMSFPNLDYIRVAGSYESEPITEASRGFLAAKKYSVTISDKDGNSLVKEFDLSEVYPFELEKIDVLPNGKNGLTIKEPVKGYTYQWYANDHLRHYSETVDVPLTVGTEFYPTKPGTYYLSAKNNLTNVESENRIGFTVNKKEEREKIEPYSPYEFTRQYTVMWYDASDLDGDGRDDFNLQDRGPTKAWKEKTRTPTPGNLFANYYPNTLNGLAVAGWDKAWVTPTGKTVTDYQTIIMLYKESDVSFTGTCPFRGVGKYFGKAEDTSKALFDRETTDDKTKNGRVFLNGKQVDPFTTPNPMDYCILTVELESPATENAGVTEGYWEGTVAEVMMFNRKLTDQERKGVEEYLRLKWFSSMELEF